MSHSTFLQGHALIIAVANYPHINPLPSVVLDDAEGVATVLCSRQFCGYLPENVETLLDASATKKNVFAGLNRLAAQVGPDDTVCIYFSGHGGLPAGAVAGDSYLLPFDCKIEDFADTSISSSELSDALQKIKAGRLLVFLDACHAAGAVTLKGSSSAPIEFGFHEKSMALLSSGIGRVIFASSRSSETSLIMRGEKNSAFTTELIEGLKGAADIHGDGLIKVFELFQYVATGVPKKTGDRQHPVFKANDLEHNFPIALACGGTTIKASPVTTLAGPVDESVWAALNAVLPELYPSGPGDQEIWARAGGDISRLQLQSSGRAAWFSALKKLKQGGGGSMISATSLVDVACDDFSGHTILADIQNRLK